MMEFPILSLLFSLLWEQTQRWISQNVSQNQVLVKAAKEQQTEERKQDSLLSHGLHLPIILSSYWQFNTVTVSVLKPLNTWLSSSHSTTTPAPTTPHPSHSASSSSALRAERRKTSRFLQAITGDKRKKKKKRKKKGGTEFDSQKKSLICESLRLTVKTDSGSMLEV